MNDFSCFGEINSVFPVSITKFPGNIIPLDRQNLYQLGFSFCSILISFYLNAIKINLSTSIVTHSPYIFGLSGYCYHFSGLCKQISISKFLSTIEVSIKFIFLILYRLSLEKVSCSSKE